MSQYRNGKSGEGVWVCIFLSIILGILVAAALDIREDALYGDTHRYTETEEESYHVGFSGGMVFSIVFGVITLTIYGVVQAISHYNSPEEERKRILQRHPPYQP
jgi:hypothetical protein